MVSHIVLANKTNIKLEDKSANIAAEVEGNGSNFFLNVHPRDVANYSRQGNDLTVELKNGHEITIRDFFVKTLDFNNLILKDDNALELVDFSKSLNAIGDHIDDLAVLYNPIADVGANLTLLGILGAAAAGLGGVAIAAGGKHDGKNDGAHDGGNAGNNGAGASNGNGAGAGGGAGNSGPAFAGITSIGPDSGADDNDFITNAANITINGIVSHAPGAKEKVQVRIDGGDWQEVTVNGNEWSYDNSANKLTDGKHIIETRVVDETNGKTITSSEKTITIATTAPDVGKIEAVSNVGAVASHPIKNGDAINHNAPSFSGKATPGTIIHWHDETGTIKGEVTTDKDGHWSFTTPELGEGKHKITITSTDIAGNVSKPVDFDFTVNPMPKGFATLDGLDHDTGNKGDFVTNDSLTDLVGSYSGLAEGEYIEIHDLSNNGGWMPWKKVEMKDGKWIFKTSTIDGVVDRGHYWLTNDQIEVRVVDKDGNYRLTDSRKIIIDKAAPEIKDVVAKTTIEGSAPTTIAAGGKTNDKTPTFSGKTEAGATVKFTDKTTGKELGTVKADKDGNWTFTTPELNAGGHKITIIATDIAGNTSKPKDFDLTIQTPIQGHATVDGFVNDTGANSEDFITKDNYTQFKGTYSGLAKGEIIELGFLQDGVWSASQSTVKMNDGQWICTLNDGYHWTEGTRTIGVRIVNKEGISKIVDTHEYTIDITAPEIKELVAKTTIESSAPTTIAAGGKTNDKTPTFSGKTEANATVKLTDTTTGKELGTVKADKNGNWAFTTPDLVDGNHKITIIATDIAGNVSAPRDFNITVEATQTIETTPLSQSLSDFIETAATSSATINLDELLGTKPTVPAAAPAHGAASLPDVQLVDMVAPLPTVPLFDGSLSGHELALPVII